MMTYFSNHCWCHSSHWDSKNYDCRHIVGIEKLPIDGDYRSDEQTEDWTNLITAEREIKVSKDDPLHGFRDFAYTVDLKPEVMKWLEENVEDRKKEENNKGWCIGDDAYRSNHIISFDIFFHRRRDAMKFIKTWSVYKKPIEYFNYFTEVRKKLNIETGKLELEER